MASNAVFARVAALAGDPARAGMLHALMDGRALTASELAGVAGITAQTASGHLARMAAAGLLRVEKQGRHRYHRLATPAGAQMMETILLVAADLEPGRPRRGAMRAVLCDGLDSPHRWNARGRDHAAGMARISRGVQSAAGSAHRRSGTPER